jgi:hypothetical protein
VSPAFVIIGLAVIGLVVTLLVSRNRNPSPRAPQVLGTQTQRPGPTAAPTGEVSALSGYTLVAADAGADVAIAPFSGARRTVAGFVAPGYPEIPVRTGGSVVVVTAGTAYALTPPLSAPVAIGPADHVFPALTPGGVGIWRTSVAPPTMGFVAVPGTGATGSATVTIPPDLRPLAELPSGILVENVQIFRGRLRVWRPSAVGGPGTFVRTIGTASAVLGSSGDRVAWLAAAGCTSNGECPLHITDAATGIDAVVAPPPGFAGYLPGGAFSPTSNQLLGAYVFNPVQQAAAARLVLVTFTATTGQRGRWTPVLVPQADVDWARTGPPLSVVWTPDGAHVLFSGSSGRIHDYRVGATTSGATEQPASASFTVVGEARSTSPSPPPP